MGWSQTSYTEVFFIPLLYMTTSFYSLSVVKEAVGVSTGALLNQSSPYVSPICWLGILSLVSKGGRDSCWHLPYLDITGWVYRTCLFTFNEGYIWTGNWAKDAQDPLCKLVPEPQRRYVNWSITHMGSFNKKAFIILLLHSEWPLWEVYVHLA